jgi:hypothetical protein
MTDLPIRLQQFIRSAVNQLRPLRIGEEHQAGFDRLKHDLELSENQVDQPCVVAVVGRMKAGKSTFINALLGEDLAKVGVTETTATINYFRHGVSSSEKPVRCHWRDGRITEEDKNFLDRLQGNDAETLRQAARIHHLEYLLLNPFLEQIVLVDTPGLSAVVDDHVTRTEEFLRLQKHHADETTRLGSEADAVIYLVGQVARVADDAFLKEFGAVSGGQCKATNAFGVLAKIDLQPELLRQRDRFAGRIAEQLKNSLNTVVPVSAGIQRAVGQIDLPAMLATLARIPPKRLSKLLDNADFFTELEVDDCPVTPDERRQLLGQMPWAVFTALAHAASECGFEPARTLTAWQDLAGFARLRETLQRQFIQRGRLLKCYRVANDVRRILNEVKFIFLPRIRAAERAEKQKLERFAAFVHSAGGDTKTRGELVEYLSGLLEKSGRGEHLQAVWGTLDQSLSLLISELDQINSAFAALQWVEGHAEEFSTAEQEELRCLFGRYGTSGNEGKSVEEIIERQRYWLTVSEEDRSELRRQVGQTAMWKYGAWLI